MDDGCGELVVCGEPCEAPACDAAVCDAGSSDAGPRDGGSADGGPGDGGQDDAGPADGGADAGTCVFGVCSCTPKTCTEVGRSCGEAYDECGGYRDCGPCPDGGQSPPYRVRVMAANTTSGNFQSYDPGEGIRLFQGLHPDIALVQELNYGDGSPTALRAMVDSAFGPGFYFFRESGVQIPNAVVSRFPIREAGAWTDASVSNRSFVWARIDVPGPKDLWAVSVHLLTTSSSARSTEATQLVGHLQQAVPAGDYLVVGGDLNTSSRGEACVTKLAQVVSTSAPHPADQSGNTNTSANRSSPYDWVMPNAQLRARSAPVVVGAQTFDAGLVFDSRVFQPLSDASPVLATDSAAANMQHMPVVKDFALP